MAKKIAVYPGSFDPITNGHCNIVERAAGLFDELIVAVANNSAKRSVFSIDERMDMVAASLAHVPTVKVDTFDGLLVDYLERIGACILIRGLRAISDFEYEFQIAHINRRLAPRVDSIFMMTSEEYFYVSSSIVREIASLGGKLQGMVPPRVEDALRVHYGHGGVS